MARDRSAANIAILAASSAVVLFAFSLNTASDVGRLRWPGLELGSPAGGQAEIRWVLPGTRAVESGLSGGDVLLEVRGAPVEGRFPIEGLFQIYRAMDANGRVPLRVRRGTATFQVEFQLSGRPGARWAYSTVALALFACGFATLRGRPRDRASRRFLAAFSFIAVKLLPFFGPPALLFYVFVGLNMVGTAVSAPLLLRGLQLFGDRRPPGRWTAVWPWTLSIGALYELNTIFDLAVPPLLAYSIAGVCSVAAMLLQIVLICDLHRRADPLLKRQLRWTLCGAAGCALSVGAVGLANIASPEYIAIAYLAQLSLILYPVCFLIAILRYDYLDINRIISGTTALALAGVTFLLLSLLMLPRLASSLAGYAGVEPLAMQIGCLVVIILAITWLVRASWPLLDKWLAPESHALSETLEDLASSRDRDGAEGITARSVMEAIAASVHPERWLYLTRAADRYEVECAAGIALLTMPIPVDDAWLRALEARGRPIGVEEFRARLRVAEAGSVIAAMDLALLIPVMAGRKMIGTIGLGWKASGDIYPARDHAMLWAAARLLAEMQSGPPAHAHAACTVGLQQQSSEFMPRVRELSRFVPPSLASKILSGSPADSGQQELTVLFADLRRSTAFAEGRTASDVYAWVQNSISCVWEIIASENGEVLEFLGDGVMAVFSSKEGEAAKEERSVAAGLKLIGAFESAIAVPGEVSVGIATGILYLGRIGTGQHSVWSAVGDAANQAARLEGMTRHLGTPLLVDNATCVAAAGYAAWFRPLGFVQIRGRSEPVEAFAYDESRLVEGYQKSA